MDSSMERSFYSSHYEFEFYLQAPHQKKLGLKIKINNRLIFTKA